MQLVELNNNSKFAYIPELEVVWGAMNILTEEKGNSICAEMYGKDCIDTWKHKYNFLFETFKAIEPKFFMNLMDFLLDIPMEQITLSHFQKVLLAMPAEEFIWRMLDFGRVEGCDKELLNKALTEDSALDIAYEWVAESCDSFLAFSAFVRQSKRFLKEFFSLANELQTPVLQEALHAQERKIEQMYQDIRAGVTKMNPLAFSEELLGKTFRNRGPYAEFVFLPAYLMPVKACRYFHTDGEKKRQMLFLTIRSSGRSQEDTLTALKAISDENRYRIMSLLAKEGPMRGLDIAGKVSLAASTVSHHMEQLRESGLITEEQVKSSKYYGINKKNVKALLSELEIDFEINK